MATQPYYLNTLDQLESEAINPSRNGLHRPGEHLRAFPISNWTELDVW